MYYYLLSWRRVSAGLLSLALLLAYSLFGQVAQADADEYTAPQSHLQLKQDPPYQGEVTLGGGGGRDITGGYLDVLLPFMRTSENSLLFVNPRISLAEKWGDSDGTSHSSSLGLGWRVHLPDPGVILGANFYYDRFRSAGSNNFDQIGAGLEVMSHWLDFRLNYYHPLNERRLADTLRTDNDLTVTGERVEGFSGLMALGHNVFYGQQERWKLYNSTQVQNWKQTFDSYEVAMEGFDLEVGARLPLPEDWGELRVFGGYMYFDSSYTPSVDGFTARVEYRPIRAIALDVAWSQEDEFTGSNWMAGMRFSLPFDMGALLDGKNPFHSLDQWFSPGSRNLSQRMGERVMRDSYTHNTTQVEERMNERVITVVSQQDELVKTYDLDPAQVSPLLAADGQPLFFFFVDPARSTGSDGSYENPFATQADGFNALGSSGHSYEALSLAAGQSFIDSAGVTHLVDMDSLNLKGLVITGNWQAFAQTHFNLPVTSQARAALNTGQIKVTSAQGDKRFAAYDLDLTGNNTPLAGDNGLLHGQLYDGRIDYRNVSVADSLGHGAYALLDNNGAISMTNITATNSGGHGVVGNVSKDGGVSMSGISSTNGILGGIYAGVSHDGDITMTGITATNSGRGGIYGQVGNGGNINMTGLTATDNQNGGIYAQVGGGGDITMQDIITTGNMHEGIEAVTTASGNISLTNVQTSDNQHHGIVARLGDGGVLDLARVTAVNNGAAGLEYGGLFVQSVNQDYQITVNLLGNNSLGGSMAASNSNFDLGFSTGKFTVNKTVSDSTGLLSLTDSAVSPARVWVTLNPVSQTYYDALSAAPFDSITPGVYDGNPVTVELGNAGTTITVSDFWE